VLVVVINNSRKKSFRKSKRIVSSVLPAITIRINLGDAPQRVILQLLKNLRESASRATRLSIFIQDKGSYHGWKCVEIGKPSPALADFKFSGGTLDEVLKFHKLLPLLDDTTEKGV
jgi:hypothetical protein